MNEKQEKIFTFKYDPTATPHQMFTKMWETIDTGKKNIQPKNVMVVNKVKTIYRVASPARLDLLTCVAKNQPLNIQELSQLLHRDYANVWRDTQTLASLGVIELRKRGQEVQPIALYGRIVFDFSIQQKKIVTS